MLFPKHYRYVKKKRNKDFRKDKYKNVLSNISRSLYVLIQEKNIANN